MIRGLFAAVRAVFAPMREAFVLTHLAGTELCVRYCEARVERAKIELSDALDARDRAKSAVSNIGTPEPNVPAFLLKQGDQ
jgi:hypothetical protein